MLKYEVCSAITTITLYLSCFRTSDADIDCSLHKLFIDMAPVSQYKPLDQTLYYITLVLLLLKVLYYANFKNVNYLLLLLLQ